MQADSEDTYPSIVLTNWQLSLSPADLSRVINQNKCHKMIQM